jgi:type II secretory pathway component PulM
METELEKRKSILADWWAVRKNRDLCMILGMTLLGIGLILIVLYKKAVFPHACQICQEAGNIIVRNMSAFLS